MVFVLPFKKVRADPHPSWGGSAGERSIEELAYDPSEEFTDDQVHGEDQASYRKVSPRRSWASSRPHSG
jgi:hypothetical protein